MGIAYYLLKSMFRLPDHRSQFNSIYANRSRLKEVLLWPEAVAQIEGSSVLDFGCGEGIEAVEMATSLKARRVVGLDLIEDGLVAGRARAAEAGVSDRCEFVQKSHETFDIVTTFSAFEHFPDPVAALDAMTDYLAPGGRIFASWSPPWYHPKGGHAFSPFPWAHLILPEKDLLRWRNLYRNDGATRFGEVRGGLNQMSIKRFEDIIAKSRMKLSRLELIPVRPFRHFHSRLTREFTTSFIRAELVFKESPIMQSPRVESPVRRQQRPKAEQETHAATRI